MDAVHVVVSPASGAGKALKGWKRFEEYLQHKAVDYRANITESLGHAGELADEASREGRTVIAMGGDGLVSSLLEPMVENKGTLAIVPFGTGNDFARALGIGKGQRSFDTAVGTESRTVDLGMLNGRYFACIAGCGFDSTVIEIAKKTKLISSRLVYPYSTLVALTKWKCVNFEIEIDDERVSYSGYTAVGANAPFFGGGMKFAPQARFDDGLLDVVTVEDIGKLKFLRYASVVFRGGHVKSPDVHVRRGKKMVINADRDFRVYADGEPYGSLPAVIESRPGVLQVKAPLV